MNKKRGGGSQVVRRGRNWTVAALVSDGCRSKEKALRVGRGTKRKRGPGKALSGVRVNK